MKWGREQLNQLENMGFFSLASRKGAVQGKENLRVFS